MLGDANDAEMEMACSLGRVLIGGMAAFSHITNAIAGRNNAAGLGAIRLLIGEPAVPIVIVPLVVSILRSTELAANLQQLLATLERSILPVEQRVKEVLALPESERAERLKGLPQLPFPEELRARRLIEEFTGP